MQTTISKQKSNYWRVFALCFFTAVLLFAPHCIVDAVAGGGYFHYAGDFNDQQINFYQYANAFVKNGGSFSWATDLGSGFVNSYSFYLLGSPFFWLSMVAKNQAAAERIFAFIGVYSLAASYVDISYLLYSVDTWVPFVIYAVTGSVLGYLTGRRRDEAEALRRKNRLLEEKCSQLQTVQGETLEIKSLLQQRITAERHSFADLYRIVQELDARDPPRILQHTVGIVENLLECDHVAVYRMDPGGSSAHLAARKDSLTNSSSAGPVSE